MRSYRIRLSDGLRDQAFVSSYQNGSSRAERSLSLGLAVELSPEVLGVIGF